MKLKDELDRISLEAKKSLSPEDALIVEKAIADVTGLNLVTKAVYTNDSAPEFVLPSHDGRMVSLHKTLEKKPVILLFYRGGWCPYCSVTLRAYELAYERILAAGGELLAVSPENPDHRTLTVENNRLMFPVLSDIENNAAKAFRLLYEVPSMLANLMKRNNIDLAKINGSPEWVLPIPGVYVLNKRRLVVAASLDADHRKRMEPEQALEYLEQRAFTGIG